MQNVSIPRLAIALGTTSVLVLAFQNCGDKQFKNIEFKGEAYESISSGSTEGPSDAEIAAPTTLPEVPALPKTPEPEDKDHTGQALPIACSSGENESLADLAQAGDPAKMKDYTLKNLRGSKTPYVYDNVRNLDANNIEGELIVKRAEFATLNNLRTNPDDSMSLNVRLLSEINDTRVGGLALRAYTVTKAHNLRNLVTGIRTVQATEVSNVRSSHFCMSASSVSKLHNVGAIGLKLVGRSDSPSTPVMTELSNVEAGAAAITRFSITRAHNVSAAYLIIRSSTIDEFSNAEVGTLVLIGTKIRSLKNFKGKILYDSNSSIDASQNVTGTQTKI